MRADAQRPGKIQHCVIRDLEGDEKEGKPEKSTPRNNG